MDTKNEHINVCIRIRPVLAQDSTASSSLQIINKEPPVLLVTERNQTFHFDHVFPEDSDQEKVYSDAVEPLVSCIKMGYSGTVFAYGQTGTGKTFTMGSGSLKPDKANEEGIIPRALKQLFDEDNKEEIQVYVSFCEIYNEKMFDLLGPNKTPLPVSGFAAPHLTKKCVINVSEAKDLLEWGNKKRHVGKTKQNSNSSRSHAIFTVDYKNSIRNTTAKLNLVDLAGSESAKKNGTTGSTFQEGININKGLLTLGQVIKALSVKSQYVPYRESMITTILHDSLNGDNYISLISCVSASPEDVLDTVQTLDFAQNAKKIKSNPVVNSIVDKFKKENSFARTPMKRATPLKAITAKKIRLPLSVIDESNDQVSLASTSKLTEEIASPLLRKHFPNQEDNLCAACNNTTTRKVLSSSSPIPDKIVPERLFQEFSPEVVFKMPLNKRVLHITPRRSLRLSVKINNDNDDCSFVSRPRIVSPIISMSPAPRRSVRLSSVKRRSPIATSPTPRKSLRFSTAKRSTEIKRELATSTRKKKATKSRATPLKMRETAFKNIISQQQNSPFTSHAKNVLNILNRGTKQEIETLHFVGSKTAEQILLYRKLKGPFGCIDELEATLSAKRYKTFLKQNFLKKD